MAKKQLLRGERLVRGSPQYLTECWGDPFNFGVNPNRDKFKPKGRAERRDQDGESSTGGNRRDCALCPRLLPIAASGARRAVCQQLSANDIQLSNRRSANGGSCRWRRRRISDRAR